MAMRAAGVVLACGVLVATAGGCGDGGGDGETRPTLSPSSSPTREPSDRPTQRPTVEASREPTQEPTQEPTSAATRSPIEESTEEPTHQSTTGAAGKDSPAADQPEAAAEESADDGVPGWFWWLLVAGVLAAGALTWFLIARSRKRGWQEQLKAAEGEVAWLARELLPQLRDTGSLEQVAGGWRVALPRVAAAEDALTVLESSAKEPTDGGRAGELRNAVRDARSRVEVATGRHHEMWSMDLDEAIARLEAAIRPDPGGRP
jgi:hypothetical protein